MKNNVAVRDNKRTRKIRTLSWSTAPRSLEVLCMGLHLIYKHHSENFNKVIKNQYPHDDKTKYIRPVRRKVIYEFEQYQKAHGRLRNVPSNKYLDYPEEDFVKGNQQGSHTNKSSIFSHLISTASQYGFINRNTYKLTPMGVRAATGQLTSDDIVAQLLKMYVKIDNHSEGIFPFQIILKLMKRFHHLTFNELSFMFGITKPQDIGNITLTIDTYRSSLKFSQRKLTEKQKSKLVKRLWNQDILPLRDVSPNFRSLTRDYPDTLRRLLVKTGIFTSTYQDLEISPIAHEKFNELLKYHFQVPPHNMASRQLPKWFGNDDVSFLPWNNSLIHRKSVERKLQSLWAKGLGSRSFYKTQGYIQHANSNELKQVEKKINQKLEKYNMKQFVYRDSKSHTVRQHILDRFYTIERSYITNPQAWLENNVARALFCVNMYRDNSVHIHWYGTAGYHFAPIKKASDKSGGVRVRYGSQYLYIKPTLVRGSGQVKEYLPKVIQFTRALTPTYRTSKIIYTLCLVPYIENGTWRKCFNLLHDKKRWNPVQVVPMTIHNFTLLMSHVYKTNVSLRILKNFLYNLAKLGKVEPNWQTWRSDVAQKFTKFKTHQKIA